MNNSQSVPGCLAPAGASRALLASLLLSACGNSSTPLCTEPCSAQDPHAAEAAWFTAWSRPQGIALTGSADAAYGGRGLSPMVDQSVRNIVRVTGSGAAARIRLTNRYGSGNAPDDTVPLQVTAATIAVRATAADIVAGTLHELTFSGQRDVTIEPGATVISDPVPLALAAGDDVAVSLHVVSSDIAPRHGASFVTSYVSRAGTGDHTQDVNGGAYTETTASTLILTGVDVRSNALRGVIAATGGSVTDGHGSDMDGYNDFPSWLSRRIREELPAGSQKTVANHGIGGSTAATVCNTPTSGASAEARFEHDSLQQLAGLTHFIVYAGTNDIAGGCSSATIIAAYRSIIQQAHAKGVRVLITTITPRNSYTVVQNVEREKVNAWVRDGGNCSGECDTSLDFDAAVRDPNNPNQIDPALDSGDGLHPTGEGYGLIAASIPLDALAQP